MSALSVYHLRYTIRAEESLALEQQPGSALRGALFHALLRRFCALPQQPDCASCPVRASCPVAELVAPLRDEAARGRDVPRPFVLRPPLIAALGVDGLRLEAGQPTHFALTLVGSAARLFPYLVTSTAAFQGGGLGRPLRANNGRRGRFTVQEIAAYHPFMLQEVMLYHAGQREVSVPELAICEADVRARATYLGEGDLTLRFLTPTRLVSEGKLLHAPDLAVLLARLAERMDALEREYAPVAVGAPLAEGTGRWRGIGVSNEGHLRDHATRWIDTRSYSARQGRHTPTGGFVGTARIAGPLPLPVRELLVWGELLHVGKDVVKGNGWYQIEHE